MPAISRYAAYILYEVRNSRLILCKIKGLLYNHKIQGGLFEVRTAQGMSSHVRIEAAKPAILHIFGNRPGPQFWTKEDIIYTS